MKVSASSCHFPSKSIGALEERGQSISNKRVQPFPSCFAGSTLQSSVTVKPHQSLIRSCSSFIPFWPLIFSCSFSLISKFHKFTTAYCRSKISPTEQFLEFHIHFFCYDTSLQYLCHFVFRITWRIKAPSFASYDHIVLSQEFSSG